MDEKIEQEEQEIQVEFSSDYEYLMCAINAYEMAETGNPLTKEEKQLFSNIKYKSLRIVDYIIGTMYDELFDDETNK